MTLWFAQNSLPLRWQRQLEQYEQHVERSCDLLKIHYLCGDKDNRTARADPFKTVVICSKFITFAVTKTTMAPGRLTLDGCDLLKIHYLCGDKDNSLKISTTIVAVVICSKFITFAVTKTTIRVVACTQRLLWFAQNSLPLRWQRQQNAL